MRNNINPSKLFLKELDQGNIRLILPFFIDDSPYFNQSFRILTECLTSINNSCINYDVRVSLIINSSKEVNIEDFSKFEIDKIILNKLNLGKLYPSISEAKSCREKFVGIIDSDVIFREGWVAESLKIFSMHNKVGVVSLCPQPNLAFYHNYSFFGSSLLRKLKFSNVVKKEHLELFERGINNFDIYEGNINWKEKQLNLSINGTNAVVGAGHFASIYRKEVFEKIKVEDIKYVFRNGDESNILDEPIDRSKYFRLSTNQPFVYHMGNVFEEKIEGFEDLSYTYSPIKNDKKPNNIFLSNLVIGKLFVKFIRKYLNS